MASSWVRFRDKATGILSFGARFVFPVLSAVAPALGLPVWAGKVIGNIVPALMVVAEDLHTLPGQGAVKKAQVLDATEQIMAVLATTFTGGASANFEKIRPLISAMIDHTVAIVNETRPDIIASDAPRDPAVDTGP